MLPVKFQKLDSSDMYGLIYRFPGQMEDAMDLGRGIRLQKHYSGVTGVVIAGMGGSAIAGNMVLALVSEELDVPFQVVRDYRLPQWAGENTLVILLSYSGSTEETLSCLEEALKRKARVAGITSGGKLKKRLTEGSHDVITIPSGYPPRTALGYLCIPLIFFLQRIGLIGESIIEVLGGAVARLTDHREVFCRVDDDNPAYGIARKIYRTIPVIYGSAGITEAAALRWRGQLEENGKVVAFHNLLPEMNHNEIVGYENNPDLLSRTSVLWLMEGNGHGRIGRRQTLTRKIIGSAVEHQLEIAAEGDNPVERLFYLVHLGDWVSFWVAMHHGTDPTPVEKIDRLKRSIS